MLIHMHLCILCIRNKRFDSVPFNFMRTFFFVMSPLTTPQVLFHTHRNLYINRLHLTYTYLLYLSPVADSMCMTHDREYFWYHEVEQENLKMELACFSKRWMEGEAAASSLLLICTNMPIPYNAYLHLLFSLVSSNIYIYISFWYSCTFHMQKRRTHTRSLFLHYFERLSESNK